MSFEGTADFPWPYAPPSGWLPGICQVATLELWERRCQRLQRLLRTRGSARTRFRGARPARHLPRHLELSRDLLFRILRSLDRMRRAQGKAETLLRPSTRVRSVAFRCFAWFRPLERSILNAREERDSPSPAASNRRGPFLLLAFATGGSGPSLTASATPNEGLLAPHDDSFTDGE